MSRKRRGWRAADRTYRDISRQLQVAADRERTAAESALPRCGCPVNAPEADPKHYPCPCGAHCNDCQNAGA